VSLQAAISWVQYQVLTVPGIGAAPDYPTDTAGATLWVYAYPAAGEMTSAAANWGKDFDTIQLQILTTRSDLNEAFRRLSGIPQAIARKIQADPSLGGNVSTYESITYTFNVPQWAGENVIGYTLNINRVKTLTTH
jgi:hypothetical protein